MPVPFLQVLWILRNVPRSNHKKGDRDYNAVTYIFVKWSEVWYYCQSIETRMNVVNIPNSLPQVHGIMNLHGEVIAVYSLAEQFHYPEQEINNIIVASMNGTKIGLEVGNVDEIIDVPDEKVISMPVIMKAVENCFDEVASYAKELIVLIEVSKLMPEAEQQAIQKLVEQQS